MRKSALLITLLLMALPSRAQFYTTGEDPASIHWKMVRTDNYKVIYPSGMDSLARSMATTLETWRKPVGNTVGYLPNESYRFRMPVVLHAYEATDNGMVTWAPSRMELLTVPDAYKPVAQTWDSQLVQHESRHVAQMQFGADNRSRVFNWVVGQIFPGVLSAAYPGPSFLEGDAVVTETALSQSGRGRTADFLEYYRVSADEGLTRNYWQWRWGSQKRYTPDYYTVGYITMAGLRTLYDSPDFVHRYYERIFQHHFFPFFNFQKTAREISGKSFKETFEEISDTLRTTWDNDREARAPYLCGTLLTPERRMYTAYTGSAWLDGRLVSIRKASDSNASLVQIEEGDSLAKVRRLRPFAYETSDLREDKELGRVYWSEYTRNPRWGNAASSRIRYMDASGNIRTITRKGRYFNPAPSSDKLAVSRYPESGGSSLDILDASTGTLLERFIAPDGLQVVESAWLGEDLYASAITDEGFALYKISEGGFKRISEPVYAKINQLFSKNGLLWMTSDRNGVNELYCFDPETGGFMQATSTRNGASDFLFSESGDTLLFSVPTAGGRLIRTVPSDSLRIVPVDFQDVHKYWMADKISGQESGFPNTLQEELRIEDPRRYSKLTHLFRLHSWVPVYIDYDSVSDFSFEALQSAAGLGMTGFFQNTLGTMSGYATYSAWNLDSGWRNSVKASFTYSGLYPVIEANIGFNQHDNSIYWLQDGSIKSHPGEYGSLSGSVKAYVPLTFNSGGWLRGFVPQVSYAFNNNTFLRPAASIDSFFDRFSASMRGYVMLPVASSGVYPRLGVGIEAGYSARPWLSDIFRPNAYVYGYGYLPGILPTHGIRISGIYQRHADRNGGFVDTFANVAPRGFAGSDLLVLMATRPQQAKLSVDYKFPFASIDWGGLGPVAYVRNFEGSIHADAAAFGDKKWNYASSFGIDLSAVLGNLAWLPYDTRIGVSVDYNAFDAKALKMEGTGHFHVGLIFSVDL